MDVFYIDENLKKRNSAGSKAPDDVACICSSCGYKAIKMPMISFSNNRIVRNIEILIKYTLFFLLLPTRVPKESVIIYQHPTLGKRIITRWLPRIIKKQNYRVIAIIHDLESLRGGIEGQFSVDSDEYKSKEIELLKSCSAVICHNRKMKIYLQSEGIKDDKLIELRIFDYLGIDDSSVRKAPDKYNVCIAGSLARGKSGYIYELPKHNSKLKVNLYGNYYDGENGSILNYIGSFKPEELPRHMEGRFGIVWDGYTTDTCAGNTGEYLRYNNPHKTSLYLGVGLPVIVWKEAAIAEFVLENHVGLAVETLNNLDNVLKNIDEANYDLLKSNAEKVGKKIRSGHYTRAALNCALKIIRNENSENTY